MMRIIHGEKVTGVGIDGETRCAHWHSPLDVIAIRFRCCGDWYPCSECHAEAASHDVQVWPRDEFDVEAVLCGKCGRKLSVNEYLDCGYVCPECGAGFNPGCSRHLHLYFEMG